MEYKYKCKSEEDSIAVQKALFDMGYHWRGGGTNIISEARFLYIREDNLQLTKSRDVHFYNRTDHIPELIL